MKGSAEPNEEDEHEPGFEEHPEDVGDKADERQCVLEWSLPATEEEVGKQQTSSVGTEVFGSEHQTPTHSTVFSPPTLNQFRLGLRHIEGDSLNLSDHHNEEQNRTHRQEEDVPNPTVGLEFNDLNDIE